MASRTQVDEALQIKILRLYNAGLSYSRLVERFRGIASDVTIRKVIKGKDFVA